MRKTIKSMATLMVSALLGVPSALAADITLNLNDVDKEFNTANFDKNCDKDTSAGNLKDLRKKHWKIESSDTSVVKISSTADITYDEDQSFPFKLTAQGVGTATLTISAGTQGTSPRATLSVEVVDGPSELKFGYEGVNFTVVGATTNILDNGDLLLTFKKSGSMTTDGDIENARILVIGGGGKGATGGSSKYGYSGNGGKGSDNSDISMPQGTYTIKVGEGSTSAGTAGNPSSIAISDGGDFQTLTGDGATKLSDTDTHSSAKAGSDGFSAKTSDITGSSVTYGAGGAAATKTAYGTPGDPNTGNGGVGGYGSSQSGGNGGSGVVIVRIPQQAKLLDFEFSGINFTVKGAETNVLDNGDLLLTFTRSGLMTTDGDIENARILVVGGGGAGAEGGASGSRYGKSGNGGDVTKTGSIPFPAGSYSIVVGAGGSSSGAGGKDSTFGGVSGFTTLTGKGGTGGSGTGSSGSAGNDGANAGTCDFALDTTVKYGAGGVKQSSSSATPGDDGTPNTGMGGQGGRTSGNAGGAGGSGIVIVRIPPQGEAPTVKEPIVGSEITYGETLAQSTTFSGKMQNAAGEEITGTFAWKDSSTMPTVADSGDAKFDVVFTPDGSYGSTYRTVTVKASVTVNRKTVTVTAENATVKVGSAKPTFSAAYAGFISGESESVLTKSPSFACAYTTSSPVGSKFDIVPSDAEAANYAFNYVNGTLTVIDKSPAERFRDLVQVTNGEADLSKDEQSLIIKFTDTSKTGKFVIPEDYDVTAQILVVAGGAGGAAGKDGNSEYTGNGGNGGEARESPSPLPAGEYSIVVGKGGAGATPASEDPPDFTGSESGGDSSIEGPSEFTEIVSKGGAGWDTETDASKSGKKTSDGAKADDGSSEKAVTSSIADSDDDPYTYGKGGIGASGKSTADGANGNEYGEGGGGSANGGTSGSGYKGIVIVRIMAMVPQRETIVIGDVEAVLGLSATTTRDECLQETVDATTVDNPSVAEVTSATIVNGRLAVTVKGKAVGSTTVTVQTAKFLYTFTATVVAEKPAEGEEVLYVGCNETDTSLTCENPVTRAEAQGTAGIVTASASGGTVSIVSGGSAGTQVVNIYGTVDGAEKLLKAVTVTVLSSDQNERITIPVGSSVTFGTVAKVSGGAAWTFNPGWVKGDSSCADISGATCANGSFAVTVTGRAQGLVRISIKATDQADLLKTVTVNIVEDEPDETITDLWISMTTNIVSKIKSTQWCYDIVGNGNGYVSVKQVVSFDQTCTFVITSAKISEGAYAEVRLYCNTPTPNPANLLKTVKVSTSAMYLGKNVSGADICSTCHKSDHYYSKINIGITKYYLVDIPYGRCTVSANMTKVVAETEPVGDGSNQTLVKVTCKDVQTNSQIGSGDCPTATTVTIKDDGSTYNTLRMGTYEKSETLTCRSGEEVKGEMLLLDSTDSRYWRYLIDNEDSATVEFFADEERTVPVTMSKKSKSGESDYYSTPEQMNGVYYTITAKNVGQANVSWMGRTKKIDDSTSNSGNTKMAAYTINVMDEPQEATGEIQLVLPPESAANTQTFTTKVTGPGGAWVVSSLDESVATVTTSSAENSTKGVLQVTAVGAGTTKIFASNGVLEYTLTLKVLPLNVTIIVTPDDNQTKVCGNADPVLTYDIDWGAAGDLGVADGTRLGRAPGEEPGQYAINLGDLRPKNTNYKFTLAEGTKYLTILPAKAQVNDRNYASVQDAVDAAATMAGGDPEVKVLVDTDEQVEIPAGSSVKIDNNGHATGEITNNGEMEIEIKGEQAELGSGTVDYPVKGNGDISVKTEDTSKETSWVRKDENTITITVRTSTAIMKQVAPDGSKALDANTDALRTFCADNGIEAYTKANTSAEEIGAALQDSGANTLPLWQDYVMGIEPTDSIDPVTVPTGDKDEEKITLSVPAIAAATPSGDYVIAYKVVDKDGKEDSAPQAPGAIKIPLETGTYTINAVLTPAN